MATSTRWAIDNHVLITELSGDNTFDEIYNNDTQILELMQSSADTVHLIIDVSNIDKFPTKLGDIKSSSERYLNLHHMGSVVVIGINNPILKFLSTVIPR